MRGSWELMNSHARHVSNCTRKLTASVSSELCTVTSRSSGRRMAHIFRLSFRRPPRERLYGARSPRQGTSRCAARSQLACGSVERAARVLAQSPSNPLFDEIQIPTAGIGANQLHANSITNVHGFLSAD